MSSAGDRRRMSSARYGGWAKIRRERSAPSSHSTFPVIVADMCTGRLTSRVDISTKTFEPAARLTMEEGNLIRPSSTSSSARSQMKVVDPARAREEGEVESKDKNMSMSDRGL